MIDEVFAKEYRYRAFIMLQEAQHHPFAFEQYYIFVNAFNLKEYNIATMCYDGLIDKLKNSKKRR